MPLETGTYISDLVASNPVPTDGLKEGDDHIRFIKSTVKATFPNITGEVTSTQAALDRAAVACSTLGSLQISQGTPTLPAYAFDADKATGRYQSQVGALDWACNGIQRMHLSPNGLSVWGNINSNGGELQLNGASISTLLVPTGAMVMWWDDNLPAGWIFANGVAQPRTGPTAALWSLWGTRWGPGDGSTTFGIPNMQLAVPIGVDGMGGATSPAYFSHIPFINLGQFGGYGQETLTAAQIPAHSHGITINDPGHRHPYTRPNDTQPKPFENGQGAYVSVVSDNTGIAYTGISATAAQVGGGGAHNNVQPSMSVNYIIKL